MCIYIYIFTTTSGECDSVGGDRVGAKTGGRLLAESTVGALLYATRLRVVSKAMSVEADETGIMASTALLTLDSITPWAFISLSYA